MRTTDKLFAYARSIETTSAIHARYDEPEFAERDAARRETARLHAELLAHASALSPLGGPRFARFMDTLGAFDPARGARRGD